MHLLKAIFQCTCYKLSGNTHALRNHLSLHMLLRLLLHPMQATINSYAASNHKQFVNAARYLVNAPNASNLLMINAPPTRNQSMHRSIHMLVREQFSTVLAVRIGQCTCCTESANAPALSNQSLLLLLAISQCTLCK
jgi:hypothetical protein